MTSTLLVVLDACVLANFSLCDTLLTKARRTTTPFRAEMVGGDHSGNNPHVGIKARVAKFSDRSSRRGIACPLRRSVDQRLRAADSSDGE